MKTALTLLLAATLTASVLLTSGCGGQVDASPQADTRASIQTDYNAGSHDIREYYHESHDRILSLHRKGVIGDGTAQRQLEDLEDACSARLDTLKEDYTARLDQFNQ